MSGKVLPEQTAYAIARMPADFQVRLFRVCPKPPSGARAEELLQWYEAGDRWEPTFACPDGKPCKRGEAFLRHDVECYAYELCGGKTCCLECRRARESYGACERMCSKAKALRKEGRDDAAAKEEARKEKQQREDTKRHPEERGAAPQAAEAVGLPDDTKIQLQDYHPSTTVAEIREYAAGDFGGKYFYSNDLAPRSLSDPAKISKLLGCSTDYILGITEELHPGGEGSWHWWPEEPQEDGLYWCIKGPMHRGGALYWWSAKERHWEDPAVDGCELTVSVKLWMPCPELPESMTWERVPL